MKRLPQLLNVLFYFLYFLGACVIVMLAEALLVSVVEKFVALPYPVLTVIRIVVYTVGVTVIQGVLGYNEGYREAECSVRETVLAGAAATVLHLLFAMLFKFQGFVAGGTRFLAGLLHNGWDVTYNTLINETPYLTFVGVFLGYAVLYVTVLTVAKYVGARKRIIDRAELRQGESSEAAS